MTVVSINWKDKAQKYRLERDMARSQIKQFRETLKSLRAHLMIFRERNGGLLTANIALKKNNDMYRTKLTEVKMKIAEEQFAQLEEQVNGIFAKSQCA